MTAPTAPSLVDTRSPTAPFPLRRAGLVAITALGPLSIAAIRALLPYASTDGAGTITANVAAHQTAQAAVLWLALLAMAILIPNVLTIGQLAYRHSRRLGAAGTVLAIIGFSFLGVISAVDFTALAAAKSGVGLAAATSVVDGVNGEPTVIVGTMLFVLGHVLGVTLLGVAFLKARLIPRAAAWALTVSQPLHFVFAVVVPSNVLDAAAWGLTTIGFAAAAFAVTRPEMRFQVS